jgi:hypothetical protein
VSSEERHGHCTYALTACKRLRGLLLCVGGFLCRTTSSLVWSSWQCTIFVRIFYYTQRNGSDHCDLVTTGSHRWSLRSR